MQNLNPIYNGGEDREKNVSLTYLFENLDLSPFWRLQIKRYALNGWTRTLDWQAMFRACILKELWRIGSRRKLVKLLESDKRLLELCGFESPPDHSTFSKFARRIGSDVFMDIFYEMIRQLSEEDSLGKIVAMDSTLIQAYSRHWNNERNSDADAELGYCAAKKAFVFGYKVHLACDARLELPLAFTVTPANVYDSTEYTNLMENLMLRGIKPNIILADAGYDSKANMFETLDRFGAIPIIAMNRRNAKNNERCWEKRLPIKRNSEEWKNLYRERGSIERIFSRLKEDLDLKSLKVRGLDKVRIHVTGFGSKPVSPSDHPNEVVTDDLRPDLRHHGL